MKKVLAELANTFISKWLFVKRWGRAGIGRDGKI